MRYLTPQAYRLSDDGIMTVASTAITDLTLQRMIARAEAAIDAYMMFDTNLGGFDPHVIYAQRGFDPTTRRFPNPLAPVPVRNIQRYRIHISNNGTGGVGFYANISPNDAVMNTFEGYVEIVPLNAVTYSLTPVIYQLGLKPPLLEVDMEVGYYIPRLGVQLVNDSGDLKTYRAPFGFWASSYTQALSNQPNTLPPVPPVAYANGVVTASSGYTVNYTEGFIAFSVARAPSDVITADVTATLPDQVTWACVAQVTELLAERSLNQMGGRVLDNIRAGEQSWKRRVKDWPNSLCQEAVGYLRQYRQVPMA